MKEDPWKEARDEFDEDIIPVRDAASLLLTKNFGKRCPGFDADCLACQRWKLLDALLKNPFDD